MKLLAIDTATEGCSAALLIDQVITQRMQIEPRKHAELILPMIDELLAEAGLTVNQLDALAFGRGPGAFTGVRIATGVIQGIAYGADLPVVPVSTLRALAQRVHDEYHHEHVLASLDARMNEVYWGVYQSAEDGLMLLSGAEQVLPPTAVNCGGMPVAGEHFSWVGAGSGWQAYPEQLSASIECELSVIYPEMIDRAYEIARLAAHDFQCGLAVSAEMALPVYLRNQVAWKK